jgi:hypothetical protein
LIPNSCRPAKRVSSVTCAEGGPDGAAVESVTFKNNMECLPFGTAGQPSGLPGILFTGFFPTNEKTASVLFIWTNFQVVFIKK